MSQDNTSSNKRIAKNTLMLYIRMGISIFVGLYTSRVVLQVLGVEDYGIYGLVWSVVAMFGFLNGSMSGATSRFLTYGLGKGDARNLRNTFSTALVIHICIAGVVILLAETIGLWVVNNKLVIPEGREFAVRMVYQLSIVGAIISICQVPFSAAIIAHERMDVYAAAEIVRTFLKLGIVYMLALGQMDKLILYALLELGVGMAITVFYVCYSSRCFNEVSVRWFLAKDKAREIASYTVFSLFPSFALVGKRSMIVVLVNMFFGVAVNAAASLAATVSGIIQGFTSNVITAIRPPLIRLYAQDAREDFLRLFYRSVVLMVFLMGVSSMPFILEMDYILHIWLDEVPQWTSILCRLSLLATPLIMAETVVNIANTAHGKIRNQTIFSAIAMLLQIPVVYIAFRLFHTPIWSGLVSVCFSFILFTGTTYFTKLNIPYFSYRKVLFKCLMAYFIPLATGALVWYVSSTFEVSLSRLIVVFVAYEVITLPLGFFFLFDKEDKQVLKLAILKCIK